MDTELDRASARAICDAVTRFGEDSGMEWSLVHTAERIGLRFFTMGGTLEGAISAGTEFLRSFNDHPSRVGPLHDPAPPGLVLRH